MKTTMLRVHDGVVQVMATTCLQNRNNFIVIYIIISVTVPLLSSGTSTCSAIALLCVICVAPHPESHWSNMVVASRVALLIHQFAGLYEMLSASAFLRSKYMMSTKRTGTMSKATRHTYNSKYSNTRRSVPHLI